MQGHFGYAQLVAAHLLENGVQPYQWGTHDFIPELLGRPPSAVPQAELWMGVHPKLPSRFASGETLGEFILKDPSLHLGRRVADKFGQLPFLAKVLSAQEPLSLQAHPDQSQAERGFLREEAQGIALSSPERNYKDKNHKPEALTALTPFFALSGFRPWSEISLMLSAFGCTRRDNALTALARVFEAEPSPGTLEDLVRGIFHLSLEERRRTVKEIAQFARLASPLPAVQVLAPWMTRLAELHPEDPGVIVSLLLRLEELRPGETLFLSAGSLHAYLSGTGIEVMASSDNVLRGGLTSKHVDPEELCRVLRFEPSKSSRSEMHSFEQSGLRVVSPALSVREFAYSFVSLSEDDAVLLSAGPEVWLVLEGTLEISDEDGARALLRGQSVFCSAQSAVELRGRGLVVRVTVPGP